MSALGSLVVKLALEYAQYTQGLNKSEQETLAHAKRVQDAFDGIQNKVNSVARNVGATLVAGLGVAALTGLIATAVRTGESLHDLSTQTGATVESLSGLASAGKTSNTGLDQIANNMTRLARNLAGAREEGKGTGKAIQALGLDLAAFKQLKPEEQTLALAKAMNEYADGADKAAVAQALYGKEGAKSLPFMKDLALVGELQAKVTTAQATAADQFSDNLIKTKASSEAWKKELAMGMIPALNEGLQAFIDVTNGTGGLRDGIRQLSKDGSITEWTRNVITGVTYVIDGFTGVKRVVQSVGEYIGAAVASSVSMFASFGEAYDRVRHFDFSGATAAVRNGVAQQKTIWSSLGSTLDDIWGETTLGAKLRARMADLKGMSDAAGATRKKLTFENVNDEKDKKEKVDDYGKLTKKINEFTAARALEQTQDKALTEGQKLAIDVMEGLRSGTLKLTDEQKRGITAALEGALAQENLSEAHQRATKATKDAGEAHVKYMAQLDTDIKKQEEEVAALRLANDQMGLSKDAIGELNAAKQEEIAIGIERQAMRQYEKNLNDAEYNDQLRLAQAYRDKAQAMRDGGIKAKEIEDFRNVWSSVDRTAHDVFTNIFEGGKNAFTKLRDTLKGTLLDLLYQMTVRKWIFNIVGNVTGQSSGVMGAVGQAAGIGQGMSGLGALGSIGSAFSSGMASGIGSDGLAVSGATLIGETGLVGAGGGGVMAGMTAALGAIPVWGWAALAVAAIATFASKGGGPKTEAGYAAGLDISGRDIGGNLQGSERGDVNAARGIAQGISGSFADLADKLGLVNKKLDVGLFYSMDNAEGGTSLTQLQVTSSAGYNRGARTGGIENVARGDDALKAALADETTRVIFDALKQSDLAEQYKAFLNSVAADAGATEMQAAIDKVLRVKNERSSLEATLLDLTSTDLEKLTRTRTAERAAIDPSNAALLESLYAAQDAKKAATELATAQAAQAESAKAAATAAQDAAMAAVDRAVEAERKIADVVRQGVQDRVNELSGLFDYLGGAIKDLYGEVTSTQAMSAAAGRKFIADAASAANSTGYLPDQAALSDAVSAARGGMNANDYATKTDFDRDRLELAGNLAQIKGKAGAQLSVAQLMLDNADAQLKALDDTKQLAHDQIDAIRGVDNSVLSVTDAVSRLATALGKPFASATANVAKPAAGSASSPAFAGIQNTGSGGTGSSAAYTGDPGYAYQGGLAPSQYWADKQGTWNDPRGNNWTPPPAFASGGLHGGGLALVGEQGPEVVDLAPSRIFNASDSAAMLGGGDVVAAVGQLITEIKGLRIEVVAGVGFAARTTKVLEKAQQLSGSEALATTVV
jgi:hypothetical protein